MGNFDYYNVDSLDTLSISVYTPSGSSDDVAKKISLYSPEYVQVSLEGGKKLMTL